MPDPEPEKQSTLTELTIEVPVGTRAELRATILSYWLRELPGAPNLRNKYRYNVEKLADGSRIYLMRPTRLNKGCDFVIHCENFLTFKNGNSRPPSQSDLIAELEKTLKSLDPACRKAVLAG